MACYLQSCSLHIGLHIDLPEEFSESDLYDWYAVQPGHCIEYTDYSYKMILNYYLNKKKRPIINDEFFYEGCGSTAGHCGRYNKIKETADLGRLDEANKVASTI